MAKEYLDKTGLTYLWSKIKGQFATKASPNFTGVPTAPTAESGSSNTQIANTKFVSETITNAIKTINGTATGFNGSSPNLSIKQSGNVVTLNGYINNVNLTANTETQIASFTGVSFPPVVIRSVCGVASAAYNHPTDVAYINISIDGKIKVKSTVGGSNAVYFSLAYVV